MSSPIHTLSIHFDDEEQCQGLNEEGYQVCISKRVNDRYNVVWASQPVSSDVTFQWTDEYQVFAALQFQSDQLVEATAPSANIALGQNVSMDSQGIVTIDNQSELIETFAVSHPHVNINVGVKQNIGGNYQPIFLTESTTDGIDVFKPSKTVLVFLSNVLKGGMMYTETGYQVSQIDYDSDVAQIVVYVTAVDVRLSTSVP